MLPLHLIWFSKKAFITFLMLSFLTGYLLSMFFSANIDGFQFFRSSNRDAALAGDTAAFQVRRMDSYELIRPIISAEPTREAAMLAPVKNELTAWVDSLKAAGAVADVSIYFESLENGNWTAVNQAATYHPASFLKVPLMIALLRKDQANPGFLDQEVVFEQYGKDQNTYIFFTPDNELEAGKKYTLHEILNHMITYSDNFSSRFLAHYVDFEEVKKLFKDLGLNPVQPEREQMMMNALEFSSILKSIFNSSILNPEHSEYAAEILSNCTFRNGLKAGFPDDARMWHKFGEWNYPGTGFELHESGVVFVKNKPYLLTILTRGKNMEVLPGVIAGGSRRIAAHLLRHS